MHFDWMMTSFLLGLFCNERQPDELEVDHGWWGQERQSIREHIQSCPLSIFTYTFWRFHCGRLRLSFMFVLPSFAMCIQLFHSSQLWCARSFVRSWLHQAYPSREKRKRPRLNMELNEPLLTITIDETLHRQRAWTTVDRKKTNKDEPICNVGSVDPMWADIGYVMGVLPFSCRVWLRHVAIRTRSDGPYPVRGQPDER